MQGHAAFNHIVDTRMVYAGGPSCLDVGLVSSDVPSFFLASALQGCGVDK